MWIDFLSRSPGRAGQELRRLIAVGEAVVLTGIVVAEILQGLTRDVETIERYLAGWEVLEPRGIATYRAAAALYRRARGRGVTLTTMDTLIAAIALENGAQVFSLDKDFALIGRLVPLALYEPA